MKVNAPKKDLKIQILRDLFFYDAENGELIRKVSVSNFQKKNTIPGTTTADGYKNICIKGKRYFIHRIIWALEKNEWPIITLDHIDGNKLNNRITNLRLATPRQNAMNRKTPINNKSGIKGVCWNKRAKKWHATIKIHGRTKYLGGFIDKNDATNAREKAERRLFGKYGSVICRTA